MDSAGKTTKTNWDGPANGSMHPVKGMAGASSGWNTANDSCHAVLPDGIVIDQTFTLANAKKIVFKATVKDKAGQTFHQTLVYDRTK